MTQPSARVGGATRFAVTLLWIVCGAFIAFGLAFTIAPESVADLVTGTAPTTSSGVIDMRATYGGVAIGMGIFVGLCARRGDWTRIGLIFSLLVLVTIGAARVVGIVADGSPNGWMLAFLGLEIASVALLAFSLGRLEGSGA